MGGEGLHPLKHWYQTDTVTTGLTGVLAVTGLHFGQGRIIYPTVVPSDKYHDSFKKISQDTSKTGYTSKTCHVSHVIIYNFNK
jgi:hypothetical protein